MCPWTSVKPEGREGRKKLKKRKKEESAHLRFLSFLRPSLFHNFGDWPVGIVPVAHVAPRLRFLELDILLSEV